MHGDHKGKIQCQDMGNASVKSKVKIWKSQRVKSNVKIWKSQVQDHEMSESSGKGELCDTNMQFTSQSTLCGPSNLNTLLL